MTEAQNEAVTFEELRRLEPLPLRTGTYFSHALGREQPYAFFAPESWDGTPGENTPRYPLLVLLHGRGGNYRHWSEHSRIARYAGAHEMVIAFPDGGEGWYTNGTGEPEQQGKENGLRYEDDVIQDFLPHLQATLPLLPPGKAWGIGGMSMGGYGAVKLAMKHWHLFSLAVGQSGAYEKPMMPEAHSVFGSPQENSALRRAENPFALAELAMCRWPAERPFLFLDCGRDDFLIESSRRFKDHLHYIAYPHTYHEMPGQHTWPYWDRAFRTVLPAVAARLGAKRSGLTA